MLYFSLISDIKRKKKRKLLKLSAVPEKNLVLHNERSQSNSPHTREFVLTNPNAEVVFRIPFA